MSDLALADLVVAIHVGYVAFVLIGEILILIGIWRHWGWVRNRWFRIAHLVAILIVAGEAILNITCPLTIWEAQLRERAGQSMTAGQTVTQGTFLGKLMHELIFFDVPDWVFNTSYVIFAVLVASTFWFAPPRWKNHRAPATR
jgi:Protein of Unknown function (DUF2784)